MGEDGFCKLPWLVFIVAWTHTNRLQVLACAIVCFFPSHQLFAMTDCPGCHNHAWLPQAGVQQLAPQAIRFSSTKAGRPHEGEEYHPQSE